MSLGDALLSFGDWTQSGAAAATSALTLDGRTKRRGPVWVQIEYYGASTSSGAGTLQFGVTDCATVGGTYSSHAQSALAATSTTASRGFAWVPLTDARRFVKANLVTITGTGAVVVWRARIVANKV